MGAVLRPNSEEALEELKGRATRAGLYGPEAVDRFLAARLVLLGVGLGLVAIIVATSSDPLSALLLSLAIVLVMVLGPGFWLDLRARQRQAAIADQLPEMLGLLVVCLDAGLGLRPALERVVLSHQEADLDNLLQRELRQVLADLNVGMPMERAFRRFALRIGSQEANRLAMVMSKAATFGGEVAALLRGHVKMMRQQQIAELEETAGKASAKLALPLSLFLLPAGMLLLLAPAFLSVFSSL
jgi:tight adherence protein C